MGNVQQRLEAVLAEADALRREMGAGGPQPPNGNGNPALAPWVTPPGAAGALPQPAGWSVPIEVPVQGPQGYSKATLYLAFTAESWTMAPQIVEALIMQGFQVRLFTPNRDGGGGGGGWNGQGGGGNGWQGGGGWNRGGGGGGWGRGGGGYGGGWRR